MTTRTGCTQTLLSSDYIFFFHQRNRVFDCLLFGQAALVFSEFIFNRMRPKKKREGKKIILYICLQSILPDSLNSMAGNVAAAAEQSNRVTFFFPFCFGAMDELRRASLEATKNEDCASRSIPIRCVTERRHNMMTSVL